MDFSSKKYILLDLDGTLTDTEEGVVNAFLYSLSKIGVTVEDRSTMRWIIGPPIIESYKKMLSCSDEEARTLLAGYRDELDSITRKAKEFWSLEKENLAVFPPQHRNLNSLTVIAQVARELKINNLEQALAFGEMRLQNQELSKNADELRQKVDELNKTVDNLNNTVQKKNNTGTAIVGGVILHAVIDSIFDN